MKSTDVVIVGGGIIGTACAASLARQGIRVVLLERKSLAAGASGSGQTGVGYGLFQDEYDLRLCYAATVAYQEFAADGADVHYRRPGAMLLSEPGEEDRLQAGVHQLRELGFPCEWLDQGALRAAEPALWPGFAGAALLPEVGMVSPMRVVMELARRAQQRGAEIRIETELAGVDIKHGKVRAAITSQGRITTEKIIVAAGAWSREVGRLLGLRVPVWPLKGQVLVTEPMPELVHHLMTETNYQEVSEAAMGEDGPRPGPPLVATVLQHQWGGELLIGSSREFAGFDRQVDPARVTALARRACRVVPGLARAHIIRTYAGLRPWTPDGRPLIGPTKHVEGVYFATGHAGEGITLAILTGRLIAELMTDKAPSIDVRPLTPDRFELC